MGEVLTDVASEPVLQTYCLDQHLSQGQAGVTHSQHADLLTLRDAPLSLQLLENPLRTMVSNPDVPLPVLTPHLDRDIHHPPCELLSCASLLERQVALSLNPREGFEKVDCCRARREEVGRSFEDERKES